jgi:hypothetical protein
MFNTDLDARQVLQKRMSDFIRHFCRSVRHRLLDIQLIAAGHYLQGAIQGMEAFATSRAVKVRPSQGHWANEGLNGPNGFSAHFQ